MSDNGYESETEFEDTRPFPNSLTLRSISINTLAEYSASRTLIHEVIRELQYFDYLIEDLEATLVDGYDPDEVSALFRDIEMMMPRIIDSEDIENINQNLGELQQAPIDIIEYPDDLADNIGALAEEYNLDELVNIETTRVHVPHYNGDCRRELDPSPGSGPPRPPNCHVDIGIPEYLVIGGQWNSRPFKMKRTSTWCEYLAKATGNKVKIPADRCWPSDNEPLSSFASGEYSIYSEGEPTSKSLMRPRGGPVYILDTNGNYINCGVHSIRRLYHDIKIPLKASVIRDAMSEFYAAKAGEGLSCPTPSQELHQTTSAILSAMIELAGSSYQVTVESGPDDITIFSSSIPDQIHVDITTSSGLHSKPLKKREMVALSKYDLVSSFMYTNDEACNLALARLAANCLATEHPAFYGAADEKDMGPCLKVHRQITRVIAAFSQTTLSELAHMSYDAVMQASTDEAVDFDPSSQGKPFREKAEILINALDKIKFPDKCAIPPYPCSDITPLEPGSHNFDICGNSLNLQDFRLSNITNMDKFKAHDTKSFLLDFPACGIVSGYESYELVEMIDSNFLTLGGLTHQGPFPEADATLPDYEMWNYVSRTYASSSVAQFAEIRADLVKTIDRMPKPGHDQWQLIPLMLNKVACWYRIRDSVVDPRGYRVDWFALSSFETLGSIPIRSSTGTYMYLWPRQRLRSQEMELAAVLPRRLKITLFSMIEKAKATKASIKDILLAWQRLAITATSSTWATGRNLISCRYLSASLSSPASPFDKWSEKIVAPKTFPGVLYIYRLHKALTEWTTRDQYFERAPILGLPRQYNQLETYWKVWCPDEHADSNKNFTDCVFGLWEEAVLLNQTENIRLNDALDQLDILLEPTIFFSDIKESIRATCSLETGGKLGWSVFGSMAAAYALSKSGDPKQFDKTFSRGKKARRLVDSLTVRHSAFIDKNRELKSGTVAELILESGVDIFLSDIDPCFRFFYGHGAYYFNHDKKGEQKEREISIAEPDARIMLNKAEEINGHYGRCTSVDMLKRSDKDAYFYRVSSDAMIKGGCIQSSDASRFAAMMSNTAIAILDFTLGALGGSAHLRGTGAIYNCLAARKMLITSNVLDEIDKRLAQDRKAIELDQLKRCRSWVSSGRVVGYQETKPIYCYTTDTHCGQGMSHHGMSLLHGGALLISIAAADTAIIRVHGKQIDVECLGLVTSDDSSLVTRPKTVTNVHGTPFSRSLLQQACRLYLQVQKVVSRIPLRSVSILDNDLKKRLSCICGEFNSQDNGIGAACPLMGWREMICELIRPSSPSLVGDYLNAHAYAQSVCYRGQGLVVGLYAHRMMLDGIQARWRMTEDEINFIKNCTLIPSDLKNGARFESILSRPQSLMDHQTRCALLQLAVRHNSIDGDLDPHTRDTVFGPMMHVKIGMPQMHKRALLAMDRMIIRLQMQGMANQALMLEESKYSTVTSGRSRGIGRIGQRIRGKNITPGPFAGHEFQRGPMLESTLTWLSYLQNAIQSIHIEPEVRNTAIALGERTQVVKVTRTKFPRPITKKRQPFKQSSKPTFVLEDYGLTPFGRHANQRAQAIVVPNIGPEQRKLMQNYLLGRYIHHVTEHTLYGGTFMTSWLRFQSGAVEPIPLGSEDMRFLSNSIQWGKYTNESMDLLRSMEESYPNQPILALNYASNGVGHFHAVYKNNPYSITHEFNPDLAAVGDHIHYLAPGGTPVVLVYQGCELEREWQGTAPTPLEIQNFQQLPAGPYSNNYIEGLSVRIETEGSLIVPTAAVLMNRNDETIVLSMSRKMTRECSDTWLPHERSKMVGELAMGGYWYSAINGVSFRAFLKNHCGSENIWSAAVLGWRRNMSSAPTYSWEPPPGRSIKTLAMIGGIDSDDQISTFDVTATATGHVYVDYDGSHAVDKFVSLPFSSHVAALMRHVNGGGLLFNDVGRHAQLIDVMIPTPVIDAPAGNPNDSASTLWEMAFGAQGQRDLW